ncbi:unnamed protein product, partial [Rotaria sordida]
ELWEIDLYCHADDCSRPDLFKELRNQLSLSVGDLSAFDKELSTTTQSTTTRSTTTNSGGPQSTTTNPGGTSSTTTNPKLSVIIAFIMMIPIMHENYGGNFATVLEYMNYNSTHVYIREYPHILFEKSILSNKEIGWWNIRNNTVAFEYN